MNYGLLLLQEDECYMEALMLDWSKFVSCSTLDVNFIILNFFYPSNVDNDSIAGRLEWAKRAKVFYPSAWYIL